MSRRRQRTNMLSASASLRERFLSIAAEIAERIGACPTGKVAYDSHSKATRAHAAIHRRKGTPIEGGVYCCPHCRQWHLTKQKERCSKPRRQRELEPC